MGNSKDGKPPVINTSKKQPSTDYTSVTLNTPPDKNVDISGNADSKALSNIFKELSKDGLDTDERKAIQKIGDTLKEADIIISQSGDKATIIQNDGKVFSVNASNQKSR